MRAHAARFAVFLSTIMMFGLCPWAKAEVHNRVVAIVNDDLITLHELNHRMKQMTGVDPSEMRRQDEERFLETRRAVLDILIDEKVANEKIRELKIEVTPKEAESAIEKIKKDNGLTQEDLVVSLKERGMTFEEYRQRVVNDIERLRLIQSEVKSKIILREEEIRNYYAENKEEFTVQERIHLAAIFLKQEDASSGGDASALMNKAKDIIERIKAGADFTDLAKKYSQGPGAEEGGDLGFFKISQLDPELQNIARRLSTGDLSDPIKRYFGLQIIKVLEKDEARTKSYEEVRNAIYDKLYREEINKRYASWIKELREKAYTKVIF
jgi:peptidyl-prolyl cis-trans isomerase SurA